MCRLPLSLVLAMTCLALAGFALSSRAADPPEIQKLKEARLQTAREGLEATQALFKEGKALPLEPLRDWSHRVLEAQLASSTKQADQLAAHEAHWKRMVEYEGYAKSRWEAGRVSILEYLEARFYRLEAEIGLEQAKRKE